MLSSISTCLISTTSTQQATIEMEQLVSRAERARAIHPMTAQEMERLMLQPAYDCDLVSCDPEVAARNKAARTRLQTALAHRTDWGFKLAGGEERVVPGAAVPR